MHSPIALRHNKEIEQSKVKGKDKVILVQAVEALRFARG
jgi:hypothetical protein